MATEEVEGSDSSHHFPCFHLHMEDLTRNFQGFQISAKILPIFLKLLDKHDSFSFPKHGIVTSGGENITGVQNQNASGVAYHRIASLLHFF